MVLDDGVAYAVSGSGEGAPLLLLHGFTGSGHDWTIWQAGMASDHRRIAIDLLGHGASDSPAPERHAVERQAADIVTLLERMGAAPADVLGYSFGARVALRLAIDAPRAVQRLILESPSAGIRDAHARADRVTADGLWVEQLGRGDQAGFVRDWAAQPIFASQRALPATVRDRVVEQRLVNRPAGLAASLLGAGQGVMRPMQDRLLTIGTPTLVISGRLDPGGAERAAEVAAAIPGATHVNVDGAGHTPHVETPERFRQLVEDFLAVPIPRSVPASSA